MALGYFNMVVVFLWFWHAASPLPQPQPQPPPPPTLPLTLPLTRYDPQPSAAELVLPLVRAHAPVDKQPFIALLSDDAHAIRASRLGEVEIVHSTRTGYNDRARNYWMRQKNMYRLADMVMHISGMDQARPRTP